MLRRRQFLQYIVNALALFASPKMIMSQPIENKRDKALCLFLCGDVMTGRGIDQVLPYSCDPVLYEPFVTDARRYVQLAEELNGPIKKPVDFSYIWGDALMELQRFAPDVRIINLETSVTISDRHWPGKGIHYRMHPKNVACLTAAGIDCCVLANNHVLDWGIEGLNETLHTLHGADMATAGAGSDLARASTPAKLAIQDKGRVWVFAFGLESSGVYAAMAAQKHRPGIHFLPGLSSKTVARIKQQVQAVKRAGDIVVVSLHWGGNWGYTILDEQRQFAHQLIDQAGVDVIHVHSSHHVKGFEVYKDRLILYGCGDLLTDYEGIGGYEQYRGELGLMYFARLDPGSGQLLGLEMVPMRMKRFQLQRATAEERRWLGEVLNREGKTFNTHVVEGSENNLLLQR